MRSDKDNVIVDLTFRFSLRIIEYAEKLEAERKYVVGRQLLRSGTSIGANVREAQNAESKADFIHKFKVAAKRLMKPSIGYSCARHRRVTPIRTI